VKFEEIDLQLTSFNSSQLLQVTSALENQVHIDKATIRSFIEDLNYPLHFLDFETMGTAIPIYDNSRPYQQLVFQYSLHIKNKIEDIEHKEYLAEANPDIDPREAFVQHLIKDCGATGDILVYNIGFERGKLKDLISVYPEYSNEIESIISRLKDLMIPFQKKWYYTPAMKGSYSIKAVLPALVPELSYDALAISDGGAASTSFAQMVQGDFQGNIEQTRAQLLEYCKLDTFAMVEIYNVLKGV